MIDVIGVTLLALGLVLLWRLMVPIMMDLEEFELKLHDSRDRTDRVDNPKGILLQSPHK